MTLVLDKMSLLVGNFGCNVCMSLPTCSFPKYSKLTFGCTDCRDEI